MQNFWFIAFDSLRVNSTQLTTNVEMSTTIIGVGGMAIVWHAHLARTNESPTGLHTTRTTSNPTPDHSK